MNPIYSQGDVWLAKVYFKMQEQFKHRPIVIEVGISRLILT